MWRRDTVVCRTDAGHHCLLQAASVAMTKVCRTEASCGISFPSQRVNRAVVVCRFPGLFGVRARPEGQRPAHLLAIEAGDFVRRLNEYLSQAYRAVRIGNLPRK